MERSAADESASELARARPEPDMRLRRLMSGPIGAALAQPWLDSLTPYVLKRFYFPLSRLWAAAEAAGADAHAFRNVIPLPEWRMNRGRVERALRGAAALRARAEAASERWEGLYFGGGDDEPEARAAAEEARRLASHEYNAARRLFLFALAANPPRVRYAAPSATEVAERYGAALDGRAPFFHPPEPPPAIEVSYPLPRRHGFDQWLRFPSPSARLGDRATARVHTPAGVDDPPTVIFGHGVCVEYDHWASVLNEGAALIERGVRVIRPEAPWHGRRRPRGEYGGERLVATFPEGALDLFTGAAREWAVLADWARATSSGPVGFAGSSLGALTAQLAADCARDWPASMRPDALLLVTHCESMADTVLRGDIARFWGAAAMVEAAGWTEAEVERYLRPLQPQAGMPLDGARIVSVLGRHDRVTPYATAPALLDRWRVPEVNRFIWRRGHFSTPASLVRRPEAIARFVEVLRGAG